MGKCPKCRAPARHMPPDGDFRYDPPRPPAPKMPDGKPITDEIKDGKMLLLEVQDGSHPTQDNNSFITIGFNTLKDTGEDKWHLAGWCWSHDHFVETDGTPVRWWPLPSPDSPRPDPGKSQAQD